MTNEIYYINIIIIINIPIFFLQNNILQMQLLSQNKTKKPNSNDPFTVPKSNVHEGLNGLTSKHLSMKDSNADYKNTIYDLQIKKAKVELEAAVIDK